MRPSITALRRASGVVIAVATASTLAACSSGGKLGGPSWNLTGGKGAAPIPERPIHANPPQAAGHPAPERPPIYRGGRDPVSGRAPAWGSPQGFDTSRAPAQQPVGAPPASGNAQPSSAPLYTPPRPAAGPAGARTIEVRPGQSLSLIAAEHRVSIASLMQANGLRDAYVIPGQTLVIPPR